MANVLCQIYFMNFFFGGQFFTYGWDVMRISELPMQERVDPMSKVFPKVKKKIREIIMYLVEKLIYIFFHSFPYKKRQQNNYFCFSRWPSVPSTNMDLLELWKLPMDCVSWQLISSMKKSMSFYGFGSFYFLDLLPFIWF